MKIDEIPPKNLLQFRIPTKETSEIILIIDELECIRITILQHSSERILKLRIGRKYNLLHHTAKDFVHRHISNPFIPKNYLLIGTNRFFDTVSNQSIDRRRIEEIVIVSNEGFKSLCCGRDDHLTIGSNRLCQIQIVENKPDIASGTIERINLDLGIELESVIDIIQSIIASHHRLEHLLL